MEGKVNTSQGADMPLAGSKDENSAIKTVLLAKLTHPKAMDRSIRIYPIVEKVGRFFIIIVIFFIQLWGKPQIPSVPALLRVLYPPVSYINHRHKPDK